MLLRPKRSQQCLQPVLVLEELVQPDAVFAVLVLQSQQLVGCSWWSFCMGQMTTGKGGCSGLVAAVRILQ
jgi:hypothetical protein